MEKPLQRHAGTAGELHEFRVADPPLLSFPLVPKLHLGMTLLAKFHFSGAEPGGEAQLRGNGDSQAQLGNECEKKPGTGNAEAASILSFAIDCTGTGHRVPEPLASRLRAVAAREDTAFCALPHDLKTKGGFVTIGDVRTPLWTSRPGGVTTAQVGMMCVARYENTGHVGHRELMHAAADAYLHSMPAAEDDVWPATFGHVINLQLAAWRSTARQVYLDRARELGDAALEKFFDNSPLPRASLKVGHYESITGADSLALALLELHLHALHITAVRCRANTIDR